MNAIFSFFPKDKVFWLFVIIFCVFSIIPILSRGLEDPRLTFAFDTDEYMGIVRVTSMGDDMRLNPRYFQYGTLYIYLCLLCFITIYFAFGYGVSSWFLYVLAARGISLFFGIILLIALYKIAIDLFNRKTALLTVLFAVFNFTLIKWSGWVHPDMAQASLIVLGLYFCQRIVRVPIWQNIIGASICSGLAAGAKYSGIMLIPFICIAVILSCNKKRLIEFLNFITIRFFIIGSFVLLSFFITSPFVFIDYKSSLTAIMTLSKYTKLGNFGYDFNFQGPFTWLPILFYAMGGLVPIFFIASLKNLLFDNDRRKERLLVLLWIIFYILFLLIRVNSRWERLILTFLPIIFVFAASFFNFVLKDKKRLKISLIVMSLFLMSTQYISEILPLILKRDTRLQCAEWLKKNISQDARIASDNGVYIPSIFKNTAFQNNLLGALSDMPDADVIVTSSKMNEKYTDPFFETHLMDTDEDWYWKVRNIYTSLFNGKLGYQLVAEFKPIEGPLKFNSRCANIKNWEQYYMFGFPELIEMVKNPDGIWGKYNIKVFVKDKYRV